MNTQREVFNKLFKEEKTELATQKIELGAIDDIEKDWKELNKIMDDASPLVKKLSKLKGRGKTLATKISKEGKETIKKLEDLGINAEAGFVRSMVAVANNSLKQIQQNFPF
tara:strand:+ start:392 stop:724 length:333 start_codon:yes stop_codon:yes gene_type:complete